MPSLHAPLPTGPPTGLAQVKLPFLKTLRGYLGGQAWRTLETMMQVSARTRWLVAHDWVRASLFGRNISDV